MQQKHFLARAASALGRRARRFAADRRGSVTTMFAALSPVLIGAMGMGGEVGYWYLTEQKLQNAADVAAHGAAHRLSSGDDATAIEAMAQMIAAKADIDLSLSEIAVNIPPNSGPYLEDSGAVEIVLRETIPRMFSAIFDNTPVSLEARAVATMEDRGTACVLALNPDASRALTLSGNAGLMALLCEFVSNSTAGDGFYQGGSSMLMAGCVRSAGGLDTSGALTLDCGEAKANAKPVDDPFADLTEPALVGNCEDGGIGSNGGSTTVTPVEAHSSGMTARRFCNGVTLRGDVTFQPGLYLIEGGDFRINANAHAIGTGVVFYLADGVELRVNGNARIDLAAPATGPFPGVLVFSSRDATSERHLINGSAGSTLSGAIYAAASEVDFQGNAATAAIGCTQIVADTITFTGSLTGIMHCMFPPARTIDVGGDVSVVE